MTQQTIEMAVVTILARGEYVSIYDQLTVNSETKTIAEWSEQTGISFQTIKARLISGWSPEKAIKSTEI